jgi:hypothetical protein
MSQKYSGTDPLLLVTAEVLEGPPGMLLAAAPSWALYRWRLRFGGDEQQPMERLEVDASQRDEVLRKAGL